MSQTKSQHPHRSINKETALLLHCSIELVSPRIRSTIRIVISHSHFVLTYPCLGDKLIMLRENAFGMRTNQCFWQMYTWISDNVGWGFLSVNMNPQSKFFLM